ncbi:MAG: iron-sulfur cluster assembly scaffold protein [Hyphomicrobiaceae bacterium]|nr:iron-sulfur cluster assembly scaffold protein [Hyphomicrobiaceae bacterium]
MSDLDDIYNSKIMGLAAAIPRIERLRSPGATASARSKLCGSEIAVDVSMADGKVTDYGQTVKACLLGQAAASVMGREIVGSTPAELQSVAGQVRAMLKDNGPPPEGRWADLMVLEPVRDYKHRHDAVLIVFEAVNKAIAEIEAKAAA